MAESAEEVVGDLPVVANLAMGFEKLTLFFTDRRIIVSRRGKTGAGSVPATFMFGSLGGAISSLLGRGSRGSAKSKTRYLSPVKILSSDKENFAIAFEEVVGVDLTRTSMNCGIAILSRDYKLDFTSRTRFDLILSLFQNSLGSKLTVHRKE